ncbi:hypothetical protein TYRP_021611 [Tyrophagus putrescentiae]|nr:hypothetical protein TYRP_022030 [Tyrophagus putrescentiae]KAH9393693.1 hypothetical protein TYRP_021611 [Tyrophagus putrescentiae]
MASLRQGIVMFASTAVGGRQCHSTFTATAATNRRIGALNAFNLMMIVFGSEEEKKMPDV